MLIGRKQAVVSTNDMSGDGIAALAERAVAMARVAPEDKYAGLADAGAAGARFPRPRPDRPRAADVARARDDGARAPKRPALAVKGVTKSGGASASAGIGGMVLVTSHGFRGAYLGSRHGISMPAIAGEGTGMERDYDFARRRTPPIWKRRRKSAAAPASARSRGSTRARSRPGKVPVVFDPRIAGSLVGHLAAPSTAPRSRARPAS